MQAIPEVKKNALDRWPILREGDGGKHVHQLHCALGRRGYHCGEDDEVWWQFGDATYSALLAFQVPASVLCLIEIIEKRNAGCKLRIWQNKSWLRVLELQHCSVMLACHLHLIML